MSNLASMIMEGSGFGVGGARLTHSYDHENGAGLIAMESAEALRDIFEAEFYVPNTCTIQATLEGASCVAESSQAAIMEASIRGAFEKIKEFFVKLKDKVKQFLHNIKRYLTGIFGNDEKWIKEYEKDLKAIPSADLKDYKVKMYNYTIDSALSKDELSTQFDAAIQMAKSSINSGFGASVNGASEDDLGESLDQVYKKALEEICGKSVDEDEVQKTLWSVMRDGAESESEKEDITVSSNMNKFIDTLKKSSKDLSAYDSMISKTDSAYNKAIKLVNDAEKAVDKAVSNKDDDGFYRIEGERMVGSAKGNEARGVTGVKTKNENIATTYTAYLRKLSSTMSKIQTADNQRNTAAKTALVERNAAYKKALMGAFGYARKNKKK